ncbi:arginine deiminase [Liquorilactobacillus oeni]|uniref:Arginine deiminase n=1 Tax=Liquorilactobacillus oeni DSM 19972 TaxID=1423777 RepID=A0A0R1ML86_9LACO|nr:arginine deiminase [Liquorilactobacillus oeni]KRL06181.1 arginine deiminase [Liquorilactobacillus oeni DSM 19972]
MQKPIQVFSEIGKLKTVILKRPSTELENLTPKIMPRLLFDDIPFLPHAQKEHDYFAKVLRNFGTEVLYLNELIVKALTEDQIKEKFVSQVITESGYSKGTVHETLKAYLLNLNTENMISKVISGIRKDEIELKFLSLEELSKNNSYPFFMDPMPNLYFTRDPAAAIGEGLSINRMTFAARQRESLIMEYIIAHHPRFTGHGIQVWRNRNHDKSIEGGDELVLSKDTLAIGISQRTTAVAIEDIARGLFEDGTFKKIIAIRIPHSHAMMHLDTVFTMINHDQFIVHPEILNNAGQIDSWILRPKKNGEIAIEHQKDLKKILKQTLNLTDIDLIPTGAGDEIVAAREQWNDGSNTLAIAPGEVVTYDRNYVSNKLLKEHGIIVHEIHSSELSRGRGGPRCMSMPLVREV